MSNRSAATPPPPPPPTDDEVIDESDDEVMDAPAREPESRSFSCRKCGATLRWDPGAGAVSCQYCGHTNPIPETGGEVEELDFHTYIDQLQQEGDELAQMEVVASVHCDGCGADVEPPADTSAFDCPFCGAAISTRGQSKRLIKPRSLLPFQVPADKARELYRDWIKKLWFAPNKLKKYARAPGKLQGIYVPYWTYDTKTTTSYTGRRGEHYYVTRTVRDSKGNTRTRRVRKTRWYPASGVVFNDFDDILVLAAHSLPTDKVEKLEPWDLGNLAPYDPQYTAGFRVQRYQVDLPEGFENAKQQVQSDIDRDIRRDIGGDVQRIHSKNTRYDDVRFKHILLPVWISSYRFKGKVYRFVVNGRTGEVQGERPWSAWKIALAVLAAALAVIAFVAY
ncbi:MAG: primosomal protein N' (replication factor Y) - superfamily II helicase, partial [Phycisphaeraceae bacterium]